MKRSVIGLALVASCGRIGFDAQPDGATGGTFVGEQTYIQAPNSDRMDYFGNAVAISADGNYIVVGAEAEDGSARVINGNNDNAAPAAGAAYVFARTGDSWTLQAYLKAANGDPGDRFGAAVAIAGDGSRIAVTAPGEASVFNSLGDNSQPSAGVVYMFARSGATWSTEAAFKAASTQAGDYFGASVALSGDGNTLVVGAHREDGGSATDPLDNSMLDAGAAYVFERDPAWLPVAYLKASNREAGDYFGLAVAISADATTIAVGAHQEDTAAGAVYVFGGPSYTEQAYLKASDPSVDAQFGVALSLSATGDRLLVGAHGIAVDTGAAYVFERTTTWAQTAHLEPINPAEYASFGRVVTVAANSPLLVVSAPFEMEGSGGAYVYTPATSTWELGGYLQSPIIGRDHYGNALSLSGDGRVLVIGASDDDGVDDTMDGAGAIYILE